MRRDCSGPWHPRRRTRGRGIVLLIVSVGLVAGGIVATAAPASAAPAWSVAPHPQPFGPPRGGLVSLTCPSLTSCFAVGGTSGGTTLIEHWDGTKWSVVPSPNPAGGFHASLNGISCPSPTSCYAVGFRSTSSGSKSLVERWNGTTWAIPSSPSPNDGSTDAHLNGVSCPTTTTCYAVGFKSTDSVIKTFVQRWDGTSWSIVASPNAVYGATRSFLSGVSCPSTTSCYAVGYKSTSTTTKTFAERWNGTSWSIVASPNPTGTTNSNLLSVSCLATTNCFAVGFDGSTNTSLVEQWDGTSWSIVASPNPPNSWSELSDVRCLSAASCFAVGGYYDGSTNKSLVEHWDGTSWSIVASPNPAGGSSVDLMSVACLSETSCFTVGDEDNYTLVEHWDGTTWSIVAAPSGASQSQLAQVACASATTCIAVGNYVTASDTKTLVEQSSGTSWAIVASPNAAGATKSVLSGVSCPGSTTCIAVGDSVSPSSTSTLVEQWNGTSWSIVSSPNPAGATKSVLSGVSCATTTSCFAVGEYFDGSDTHGLVESWDGTSWSIATISTPAGASGTTFNGVSCPNATSCSAVGSYDDSSTHTLVDHWDGTTWSVQASPNPSGSQFAALNGVSCATTTTCVAVGESIGGPVGSQTGRTLAERWNGTSWSIVASPTPSGSLESALMGVSCPSATNCYAVGSNQSSNTVALVEHWNGTTWSQMTVPKPIIATDFVMRGVSCSTTTTCLAVGDYSSPASDYTLIERYA